MYTKTGIFSLLAVTTVTLLAGCGSKESLTFDQAYDTFITSMSTKTLTMMDTLKTRDKMTQDGTVTVKTDNAMMKVDLSLTSKEQTQLNPLLSQADIAIQGTVNYPAMMLNGNAQIDLSMVTSGNKMYITPKTFNLNVDTGAMAGSVQMIQLMINAFQNKWIEFDLSGQNSSPIGSPNVNQITNQIYSLPAVIVDSMKKNKIFASKGAATEVDGHTAYPIQIDAGGFTQFIQDVTSNEIIKTLMGQEVSTDEIKNSASEMAKDIQLEGKLVVVDADTVELVIDKMINVKDGKSTISGKIGAKEGMLTVTDTSADMKVAISRTIKGETISFTISMQQAGKEILGLKGDITMRLGTDSITTKGTIQASISSPELAAQLNNQPLVLDITYDGTSTKADAVSIVNITGSLPFAELMSGMMGDPSMMQDPSMMDPSMTQPEMMMSGEMMMPEMTGN